MFTYRKGIGLLFTFLIALLCNSAGAIESSSIPGQMVVKVAKKSDLKKFLKQVDGRVIKEIKGADTYLIEIPQSEMMSSTLSSTANLDYVIFSSPNSTAALPELDQVSQDFPDEDPPPFLDGISPIDFFSQQGVYNTGIEAAQQIATGAGISVAVIDNGVDFNQPLIAATDLHSGYDFVDNDSDPSEKIGDMESHGTFVSTLVALTAPDCSIIPIRAFDEDGKSDQFTIAQAIYHAIDAGAAVINMSFSATLIDPVLYLALDSAYRADIVLVASAGNDGYQTGHYPALLSNVIAVTSFDTTEYRASFANYGTYLDLIAPGVDNYAGLAGDYDWGTWSGTSFSAPLVSGTVAMIREADSSLTDSDIMQLLRSSARTDLLWGQVTVPDLEYGYGALDAYAALAGAGSQVSSINGPIGDIDGSGSVNQTDLWLLYNYLMDSNESPIEISLSRADVNKDGRVNIVDLGILLNNLNNAGPKQSE